MKTTKLRRISTIIIWNALIFQIILVWFHALGVINGDHRIIRLITLVLTGAMGVLIAVFIRQQHKINMTMKGILWWEQA